MARDDDQQGIAGIFFPCFEQERRFVLVFVKTGAGADGDGARAYAFAEGRRQCAHPFGRGNIVFGVAADMDVGRADQVQPLRVFGGLRETAA